MGKECFGSLTIVALNLFFLFNLSFFHKTSLVEEKEGKQKNNMLCNGHIKAGSCLALQVNIPDDLVFGNVVLKPVSFFSFFFF